VQGASGKRSIDIHERIRSLFGIQSPRGSYGRFRIPHRLKLRRTGHPVGSEARAHVIAHDTVARRSFVVLLECSVNAVDQC